MRTVGLITEYNPFHNGHLHHLRQSLQQTGSEVSVAVMSGHFLQRGEPALVDKWVRAEMALAAGVDVVVELPLPFACNSAPCFAKGAVQALEAIGGVDSLCFGSESGEIGALERAARLLLEQEGEIGSRTGELLRQGVNYPEARARTVGELGGDAETVELLASPNNILGVEYLKALFQSDSCIEGATVTRIGAGFHEEKAKGGIASATGIRSMLGEGADVSAFMPTAAWQQLARALKEGRCLDPGHLHRLLTSTILRDGEGLGRYYQVEHGMERRIASAASVCGSYDELVDAVKSRHHTRTRIQRLLAYLLLGMTRSDMATFLEAGPLYLHLLGASKRGRAFLAASRKQRQLPLVSNYSRIHATLKRHYGPDSHDYRVAQRMLHYELKASALYTLLMKRWDGKERHRDFFEPVRPCPIR